MSYFFRPCIVEKKRNNSRAYNPLIGAGVLPSLKTTRLDKEKQTEVDPAKPELTERSYKLSPPKTKNSFYKLKTYAGKSDILTSSKKDIKYRIDCSKIKDQNKTEGNIPKFKKPAISTEPFGVIKAYGINSFTGFYKRYNEDKVSVILNITRPKGSNKEWPKHLSYFALFDGHSGSACCDFLLNNFHKYLIKSKYFPEDIELSLKESVYKSENAFLSTAVSDNNELLSKSGSCALIVVIADSMCYIANVGDSRAILSVNKGKQIYQLTNDHKPNSKVERKRIKENGGLVYKSNSVIYRVLPGDLSVSRTIGDAEVKIPFFGGKEGVVVPEPEITKFRIEEGKFDFLLMGCDGIFDKLDNNEIINDIWRSLDDKGNIGETIHEQMGKAADSTIRLAMNHKSTDNLSTILICFSAFEKAFDNRKNNNY